MIRFFQALLFAGILLSASGSSSAASDYGQNVADKLGSSFANMTLGWLEIPKNVINTSNQTNVLFGVTGGVAKGVLHTLGRILSGVTDFLTFPLPTQPIAKPAYVWEDFGVETQYGNLFQTTPESDRLSVEPGSQPRRGRTGMY